MTTRTLEPVPLHKMDVYSRAAEFISVRSIKKHDQDLPEIRNWTWHPIDEAASS